jgi:ADP-heptose:LPS heptosyltransferase
MAETNPKYALIEPFVWIVGRSSDLFTRPDFPAAPKKILVLRPTDFGDLLTSTPIFEALRKGFPNSQIIAGVSSLARPILANNPLIDDILELNIPRDNHYSKDQSIKANIKFLLFSEQIASARAQGPYDLGIDLVGSAINVLAMIRIGVRYRIGIRDYHGGWSGVHRYTRFSRDVPVGQSALELAALAGAMEMPERFPQIFLTAVEEQAARNIWEVSGSESKIRVLVGCGGGSPEKCYPAIRLGEALARLHDWAAAAGLAVDILLTGGTGDVERANQILQCAPNVFRSIVGETPLRVTFGVAAAADVVITNSSMLLHAAAAFRRPTLAILGGRNADAAAHDVKWGYPLPYRSIGPESKTGWPDSNKVAFAMCELVQEASAAIVA